MNALVNFFKRPIVQATIIGAFGGMAPKLVDLVPKLFANQFPSMGMIYGFLLLALFGAIIIIVYHEENLQKALILGAGAPALISALISQAAPTQNASGYFLPFNISIVSTAYAQEQPKIDTVKFVVTQDESSVKLNTLWIRADSTTLDEYKQKGDTLIVTYPSEAKEIMINLPTEGNGVVYPVSQFSKTKVHQLKISNDQQTKDFWQTFGGKSVPQYKLEKKK